MLYRLATAWAVLALCGFAGEPGVPSFTARDLVSAADYRSGSVSPGEIVILYARNAGPEILEGSQLGGGGKIATSLADTRVYFDDVPAPLVYAVQGRVGAVVPYEVQGKKTTRVVLEYRGVRSTPVEVPVIAVNPALFTLESSGQGQAAMLNESGCCNTAHNPALKGGIAILYATGYGQTRPRGVNGHLATDARVAALSLPLAKVRVLVDGHPAEILYAGQAPHSVAGLLQVNFRVPVAAPLGNAVPLVLEIGGSKSIEGVTMATRSAVRRILVAMSSGPVRDRLTAILRGGGYAVTAAANPDEVQSRSPQNPDLILYDLTSTDSGVLAAIQAIRAAHTQTKLVALAPSLSKESIRQADMLNAEAVLPQSPASARLLHSVSELLKARMAAYTTDQLPPLPAAGINRPSR